MCTNHSKDDQNQQIENNNEQHFLKGHQHTRNNQLKWNATQWQLPKALNYERTVHYVINRVVYENLLLSTLH